MRSLLTTLGVVIGVAAVNLDSRTGAEILELLVRLNRERGLTIVMVTHDHEIAARAPRHVVFRDGAILTDEDLGRTAA